MPDAMLCTYFSPSSPAPLSLRVLRFPLCITRSCIFCCFLVLTAFVSDSAFLSCCFYISVLAEHSMYFILIGTYQTLRTCNCTISVSRRASVTPVIDHTVAFIGGTAEGANCKPARPANVNVRWQDQSHQSI